MQLKTIYNQVKQERSTGSIISYLTKYVNTIQKEVLEGLSSTSDLSEYVTMTREILKHTQNSSDNTVIVQQQLLITNIATALDQLTYVLEHAPSLLTGEEVRHYLNKEMDITHFSFTYVAEILEDLAKNTEDLSQTQVLKCVSLVETLITLAEGIVVGCHTPISLNGLSHLPETKAKSLYEGVRDLHTLHETGKHTTTTMQNLETLILGLDNFTLSYSEMYKTALMHMFKDWDELV